MLPTIDEPSLGLTRARLIQDRLSKPDAASLTLPQVVATGKTGSGKSTLGNLLLGATDVLRTTGRIDCTDAIHRVRFPRGLIYVDLPGVASSDHLENYNRVAFGLVQRPDWDQVGHVRVLDYAAREQVGDAAYPPAGLPAGTVAPDVILYLLAPHQPMVRDEQPYLGDLLHRYGSSRVVHVLNIHHDGSGGRATEANMADAWQALADCHQAAGFALNEDSVVEVDCLMGNGLAELLAAMRRPLTEDQAKPLIDVITYQAEDAPGLFLDEVTDAVAGYATALATLKPASDDEGAAMMTAAADTLTKYAGKLAGHTVKLCADEKRDFRKLVWKVISGLRTEHREPVFKKESTPVYRRVPVTKTREEPDYDQPIYETRAVREKTPPVGLDGFVRAVGNLFNEDEYTDYKTVYRRVVVGYGTRRISVITGYRNEIDHIETYKVENGSRVVWVSYEPFGVKGTALALTAWYLAIRHAAGGGREPATKAIYRHVLSAVKQDAEGQTATCAVSLLPADASTLLVAGQQGPRAGAAGEHAGHAAIEPAAGQPPMPGKAAPEAGTVEVTFALPAEVRAGKVALCGEFNQWSAEDIYLERGDDGTWQATVALEQGRSYRYRYLLDGERWENARQADRYVPNTYGSADSVVIVEPRPQPQ